MFKVALNMWVSTVWLKPWLSIAMSTNFFQLKTPSNTSFSNRSYHITMKRSLSEKYNESVYWPFTCMRLKTGFKTHSCRLTSTFFFRKLCVDDKFISWLFKISWYIHITLNGNYWKYPVKYLWKVTKIILKIWIWNK